MNPVMTVLQMPIVERLGWALLHFLWQGVLIGGILLLAQRLLRGKSPAILYGVMVLGLAACVVAPVVTLIVLPAGEHHAVVQPDAWRPPVFIEQAMPPAEFHPSAPNRNVEPQATPPARRRAKAPSHVQALRAQCLARYNRTMIVLEPWTPRVAIAWCLGVIVLGARMWAGWWTTRRWIGTSASLAEPAWAKPFAVLCRKMSVDIPIRLLASAA